MNKIKKIKKLIKQNKRNRLINKRYSSTIKNLEKNFKKIIILDTLNLENKRQTYLNNYYSIVDKAVKKKVIHKNTAARKKSKIAALLKNNF